MSPREIIASTLGVDIASVTPYQGGRHRPSLWQDGGGVYAVAKRAPTDGTWRAVPNQTYARAANTTVWERTNDPNENEERHG